MKYLGLLLCLLALSGCKPGEEKAIELAKNEIASDMKDPDSAKFRDLKFINSAEKDGVVGGFVCGSVNAKNSYGAYAGFSPFFIALRMTPKGFFSKGVTYTVDDKKIFSPTSGNDIAFYNTTCGEQKS